MSSAALVHVLTASLASLVISFPVAADTSQTLTPIADRTPAPPFELQDLSGQMLRLADYVDRPVILNFWATWCPPCLAEMPAMQRAHEQVAHEGIAVIAVNVGDDPATVTEFLSKVPVAFPIPLDIDSEVVQSYPVKGLPTTFVIDPAGTLVYVAMGEREWDDAVLLDQVRALKTRP